MCSCCNCCCRFVVAVVVVIVVVVVVVVLLLLLITTRKRSRRLLVNIANLLFSLIIRACTARCGAESNEKNYFKAFCKKTLREPGTL